MQLVEQGKIDLNRDVNDYLDFKIPATFGKPITMKDLMTHTPGFEETLKDLFVAKAADMRPLAGLRPPASARADLSSRHDAGVLELWRHAGGIHCAARFRHAVRRLRREEHSAAAGHEALHVSPAAAGQSEAADVAGLQPGVATGEGLRVRAGVAGGQPVDHRRRHVALHDRAPAERPVQRRADPEAGDGAAHAFARLRTGARS